MSADISAAEGPVRRRNVAMEASAEISETASHLLSSSEIDEFVVRGMLIRIQQLADLVTFALDEHDDTAIERLEFQLNGRRTAWRLAGNTR